MVEEHLAGPLAESLGTSDQREFSAMLMSVLFGVALMRKNFQLKGLIDKSPEEIATLIHHLGRAALDFRK